MNDDNIAIRFENIGKLYRLGTVGTGTLSHDLNRWWRTSILRQPDPYLKIGEVNNRAEKGSSDYVWALRDIDFDVQKGDVVGIIGRNGAGKSTLLKLLSRITAPTTGNIYVHGRVASLLEVGTGFHNELTGRENVYMNGAIMGMTKHEIKRKFDEIIDFAGVARYVDTPVKRYSSGMIVRLGFAVAAFLEPEILVVDEVLAVGDADFQKKAVGKMNDVARTEGRTVLFVSHNMGAVRMLCSRGVVLNNGQISFMGSTEDAINAYMQSGTHTEGAKIVDAVNYKKDYLTLHRIEINDTESRNSTIRSNQQLLKVVIEGTTTSEMRCAVKMIFKNASDVPLASFIPGRCTGNHLHIQPGDFKITTHIRLPRYISQGEYTVDLMLHEAFRQDFMRASNCATLECEGSYDQFALPIILNYDGMMSLEAESIECN